MEERELSSNQRIGNILWRGKYLIVGSLIVMVALAIGATKISSKVYEATGIIQVNIPSQPSGFDTTTANQGLAQNYATLLVSRSFLGRVRPQIAGGKLTTGELQSRLSASAAPQTALVELRAQGPSPQAAQSLASQLAAAFLASLQSDAANTTAQQEARIQQLIAAQSNQITALRGQTSPATAEQVRALSASRQALINQSATLVANGVAQGASASISAPPSASSSPIKPRPVLNVLAGVLLGLLVGVGLAWLRERLRPWLRSADEAAALLDVPVLASIPLRPRLRAADPVLLEAYEILRTNLFFALASGEQTVVTFVGPNPRVGKTSTVEGLGRVAVRGGRNVLLVDGDLRAAALSSRFGQGAMVTGLCDVLTGEARLEAAIVQVAPALDLLPTRPATFNPPSLLSSSRMRATLAELRERYDAVLIDSPPIAGLADGLILASLSDAAVMVVRTGVTKPEELVSAATSLGQSQTWIAGLVVFEERPVKEYYYGGTNEGATTVRDPAMSS